MDVMHNTKAESVLNMELWLIAYAVSVVDAGIGEHRKVKKIKCNLSLTLTHTYTYTHTSL